MLKKREYQKSSENLKIRKRNLKSGVKKRKKDVVRLRILFNK